MRFSKRKLISLYKAHKTLENVASILGIHLETLRQKFIALDIPYQKRQKYDCDHDFFSRNNELTFYWAGFLAADGNIEKRKTRLGIVKSSNRIKLELGREDRSHIEKFKKNIKSTMPIIDLEKKETRPQFKRGIYYSSSIRFSSAQMVKDLKEIFGVVPAKSKTYLFPKHLLDHEFVRHFIRGLIDGDGWIYLEKIGLSGTKDCVETTFNFLKTKLRLDSGIIKHRKDDLYTMDFWKLSDKQKLINYLYDAATVILDRKYKIAQQILDLKPRKISLDRKEILRAIVTCRSIKKAAAALGISQTMLIRRTIEFGLQEEASRIYRAARPINKLLSMISEEQLRQDFQKYKSILTIAKKYRVAKGIVRYALQKIGIDHAIYKDYSEILTKEILEKAYTRIGSIRGVARELGIARDVVRGHLRRHGIIQKPKI